MFDLSLLYIDCSDQTLKLAYRYKVYNYALLNINTFCFNLTKNTYLCWECNFKFNRQIQMTRILIISIINICTKFLYLKVIINE